MILWRGSPYLGIAPSSESLPFRKKFAVRLAKEFQQVRQILQG
jgi:hypothetical protein